MSSFGYVAGQMPTLFDVLLPFSIFVSFQGAARPGLKPTDVGGAGRRYGTMVVGKRMSER